MLWKNHLNLFSSPLAYQNTAVLFDRGRMQYLIFARGKSLPEEPNISFFLTTRTVGVESTSFCTFTDGQNKIRNQNSAYGREVTIKHIAEEILPNLLMLCGM